MDWNCRSNGVCTTIISLMSSAVETDENRQQVQRGHTLD